MSNKPDLADLAVGITEHHIPALAARQVVLGGIPPAVGVGFGRPFVATLGLLPVDLLVVDPPEGHDSNVSRIEFSNRLFNRLWEIEVTLLTS